MKKNKVVFMGTSDFAVPALKKLNEIYEVSLVVTQPDRINLRGNKVKFGPVKQTALDLGLDVFQPENISDEVSYSILSEIKPDLFIVCAFGQILKDNILNIPKFGSLNIHGSVLPEYRGAAPIHHAIIDGKEESGVSIMLLDSGMDTGDVLTVETEPINNSTTVGEYHDKLAEIGADLLIKTIQPYINGEIQPKSQDNSKASYASKIEKEDCHINWNKSNQEVLRLINGLDPFPGAYSFYDGKRIKLFKPKLLNKDFNKSPGSIIDINNEGIVIQCGSGCLIFDEIQYPGKRRMKVNNFTRGNTIDTSLVLN